MKREDPLGIGFFIPKRYLLILASFVMCVAGTMVLRAGLSSSAEGWPISYILIAGAVFVIFLLMFINFVRKNCKRIMAFQAEQVGLFNFLSARGYFTMVFMMSLGLWMRYVANIPASWIQTFYTGLGSALIVAGILFLVEYVKVSVSARSKNEKTIPD
ncbi:MAG: hypothetical protein FWG14_01225 [Peptococcaceae bacterium]|nr:hypothetical protein [Peptococcaceae bacterium]